MCGEYVGKEKKTLIVQNAISNLYMVLSNQKTVIKSEWIMRANG